MIFDKIKNKKHMKTTFTLVIAFILATVDTNAQCSFTSPPYSANQPGITNFKLGTINRTSPAIEGNNALVLTGVTVTLTIGQTYSFSITSSNDVVSGPPLTGAPQHCRIYVDFNQNNIFTDAGETAFTYDYITFTPTNAASATYTNAVAVTIPSTVIPGNGKLRVTAKMGPAAGHTPPTPCNIPADPLQYHGEMEEYNVVFVAAGGTNATAVFNTPATACTGIAVTMTNNSTGSPTPTYTWSTNPAATISNTSATNPSITFASAGPYTITLAASNSTATSITTRTISAAVCSGINETNVNSINASIAPNPFDKSTQLTYVLHQTDQTSIIVYNLLGKKVAVVLNEEQQAGEHKINITKNEWMSSGIYFVELNSGTSVYRSRIIVSE
jgi:hypothetical protein